MPSLNESPNFALMTEVDRRNDAGVILFNRGGGNVVASSTQFFGDEIDELCGRGRHANQTAQPRLDAAFGVGAVTLTLDTNDRFVLASGAGTVAITARADNAVYGFSTAGHGAAASITATSNWQRGNVFNAQLEITYSIGPVTAEWPGIPYAVHSPIYMLRERGAVGDLDDTNPTDCIEALDQAVNGGAIAWGIDDTGHVWTAYDPAIGVVMWNAAGANVRDYLGYTGFEVVTAVAPGAGAVGVVNLITATYPCAGVLRPTRPSVSLLDRTLASARGMRLTDGSVASSRTASHRGWTLRYYVDGPADARDLSTQFVDQWLPYCTPGERMTLYQDWGDPRRSITDRASAHTFLGGPPSYTLLYTPERNGAQGRRLLYRDPADPNDVTLAWGSRMMRSGEQTMLVLEGKW